MCNVYKMSLLCADMSPAGYESGSVSLVDVRSPKEDVMAYEEHTRAIHRMIFCEPE